MWTLEQRNEIIGKFRVHSKDTGSPEVQVALLTSRVNNLSEHLKVHKNDKHSRRGLIMMIAHRRKLLKYLVRKNPPSYQRLVEVLNIKGI